MKKDSKPEDNSFDDYMKTSGLYEVACKDFASNQKNVIADLMKALDSNDFASAHFLVHTLKGLAALIGENKLVELAEEAELAFDEETMPAQECLDSLAPEVERILAYIQEQYPPTPELSKWA